MIYGGNGNDNNKIDGEYSISSNNNDDDNMKISDNKMNKIPSLSRKAQKNTKE